MSTYAGSTYKGGFENDEKNGKGTYNYLTGEKYEGDWFIFCGVGVPGRTGHNYGNHFVGDDLIWFGKPLLMLARNQSAHC